MDRVNKEWYARPEAVAAFSGDDLLEPTLVMLLIRYRDWILDHDVLDMGVGPGRTTAYLSLLAKNYVGIDYSPSMVAHCTRRFPTTRLEIGDARDLSRFESSSFDFVLFSYGAISALDHEGRLKVLSEVRRILSPGGLFAFSAHNRGYHSAHEGPRPRLHRNPLTSLANVVRWLGNLWNHARRRSLERELPEYALINDLAEGFRLVHYYIDHNQQRRQLADAGLEVVAVYDDELTVVQPQVLVTKAPWIWYVVRRAADSTSSLR